MKIFALSIIFCFASFVPASAADGVKTKTPAAKTTPKTAASKTTSVSKNTAAVKPVVKSKAVASAKTKTVKKAVSTNTKTSKTNVTNKAVANENTVTKNETLPKTAVSKSPLKPSSSKTYPYLAYTPQGYNENDGKKWPLIIYLHGSSCKGNNLEKLKKYGPPFYLERGMQVDAIVISPQCPSNKNWTVGSWFESFYKELKEKYKIDPSRVYLTGMSLGGFGTWDLASRYPDYFAAIVPLCGGGRTSMVENIKDIPTWVFHGDLDKKVKLTRSTEMVNAMKELGSEPKFSVLKGQGHGIQKVYSDRSLYDWLLSHQKKAYDRILEFTSFWTPKIDSVNTQNNTQKNLVTKIFSVPTTSTEKKTGKFSLMEIFSKKESYKQETLY